MRVGEPTAPRSPSGDLAWPLRRAAALHGDALAVIDGPARVSYRELAARVAALGGSLAGLGVPDGGRVGFLGVNSLPHLECWFAVPSAGRVLVDLNFRLAEAELEFIINDCGVQVLFADSERLGVAATLRQRCPSLQRVVLVDGEAGGEQLPYGELIEHEPLAYVPRSGDELAGICYTGGTTGKPKGVMLSHENLLANARHNLIVTGHAHEDRWLHVSPMFHVAGTANVFACTWAGSVQVIAPRFEARLLIELVRRESVTHCVLVPTMLAMLMDELSRDTGGGLPSIRHIQYAASPITPALQRQVLEYFSCDIVQLYGMTEAAPSVTRLSDVDHRRGLAGDSAYAKRLASVGTPIMGVEVAVRGTGGEWLPAGEVGELCVRGPNVMLGYWNREHETATALRDGWYHTGDACWMDEQGYVFLVDRLKDMIVTGGENVYSIEVESALAEHPAVLEAAVFGIPDPRWGEAVHAVVSVHPGAEPSAEALIEHCRSLIAGYKIPRSIDILHEPLPKSGPGKILKSKLREPYWAGRSRRIN
ncbi:class I adenylate-forming enzyme family protein [Conexibacter sp. S30A1]|uniref:class I adenylate-forming enzyme family protein n=1 Tax=Conexibacter sp. S30A1 TaxID=2937800 RepID=UPI00200EC696|nr:long-chain-fatty-acid--CoA ligase [Conexibacter sp. S30A1]